jgi:hypothetical protein
MSTSVNKIISVPPQSVKHAELNFPQTPRTSSFSGINNRGRIYGFKLGYEGTNLFDESYRGIKKQRREIDPKSTNSSVQDF